MKASFISSCELVGIGGDKRVYIRQTYSSFAIFLSAVATHFFLCAEIRVSAEQKVPKEIRDNVNRADKGLVDD